MRNFGHYESSTITACRAIAAILQDDNGSELAPNPAKEIPANNIPEKLPSTTDELDKVIEYNPSSVTPIVSDYSLAEKSRRHRAISWEERGVVGSLKHDDALLESVPLNTVYSEENQSSDECCDDYQEDIEDVEVEVFQAIIEEQRMMLSPDCLNNIEMTDVNVKYASFSQESSNFEINTKGQSDNNFDMGVRIVSKASGVLQNEATDSDISKTSDDDIILKTTETPPGEMMETFVDILRVEVRERQERFQAAGVCETLVEVFFDNCDECHTTP